MSKKNSLIIVSQG